MPLRCQFDQCGLSLWQVCVQEIQAGSTRAFSPEFYKHKKMWYDKCTGTRGRDIRDAFPGIKRGRIIFSLYSMVKHEWTEHSLPAKQVIPLERIHLLEFRFVQQAVTQSWVYGHVTVGREMTTIHTIQWTEPLTSGAGWEVGRQWGQAASPAQDTHMWRNSAISNESTVLCYCKVKEQIHHLCTVRLTFSNHCGKKKNPRLKQENTVRLTVCKWRKFKPTVGTPAVSIWQNIRLRPGYTTVGEITKDPNFLV